MLRFDHHPHHGTVDGRSHPLASPLAGHAAPSRLWDAFSAAACAGCGAQAAGVVMERAHHRRGQAGASDALTDGDMAFLSEGLKRTPGLLAWTPTGARRHYAASAIDEDPDVGFLWIARTGDGLADPAFATLRALGAFATLLHRMDIDRGQAELLLDEHRHRCGSDLLLVGALLTDQARCAVDPHLHAAMENTASRVLALARARARPSGDLADMLHAAVAALHAQVDDTRIAMRLVLEGTPAALEERRARVLLMAVNELVTNALTHAFADGRAGTITVHLHARPALIRVGVMDDGLPPAEDPLPAKTGSGLDLIARLLAGVAGRLRYTCADTADPATHAANTKTFTIEMPQQ